MPKTTIAMLLVFAILAGGVFALEKNNPVPTDTTVYVLEIKDVDIQRIDVTTKAGEAAFERAEPFGWKFAASEEEADLSRVSSVVNRLAKLRSSAKVRDDVTNLSEYGLAPSTTFATLSMKDGTKYKVLIGAKTPNDASYYAIVDGRTTLHTINTLLVGDIEKLVVDPPVPTKTPGTVVTTPSALSTPQPSGEATALPTLTPGLPAPSLNP